jgi:branched-chain amino acid transport system ATP-binding protein
VLENVLVGGAGIHRGGLLSATLRIRPTFRQERQSHAAARALLDRFDLGGLGDWPVEQLPYGVQKRVELARALMGRPRLLLLDEPAAGCDASERVAMAASIRQVRADAGDALSVVLVEHDMAMVGALADRVVALDFGEMITSGSFDEVRRDPRVVEAYMGAGTT